MTITPLLWAEGVTRTTFEWGRIQSNADWFLPIVVGAAVLVLIRYLYRRDAVELRPWLGWFLTALRAATFFGLLILFLQPQWRSEREVVRNSRVVLLVDASQSMAISDSESQPGITRAGQVAEALAKTDFLDRLRRVHDVIVTPFSDEMKMDQAVSLSKWDAKTEANQGDAAADWAKRLAPQGNETRLGEALRQLLQSQRGSPLSGVILLSDGGQNAGASPQSALELAVEAKIPVFTVGLGSDRQPTNVAVRDFAAPARAYPGDRYAVTGYIQGQAMAGKSLTVELLGRPGSDDNAPTGRNPGEIIESRQVILGADGEVLPVKFDLTPDAPGRRTLTFRVQAGADDRNPADNWREADVEIVGRKNHVLLLAGGPMREYHFLRNYLFRDRSTTVDVLLQSGTPGMSQEAAKLLDGLPTTRQEMFDYDCVVGCDPDWQALSAGQLDLLEKWVGEQGGGLVVIAGAVHAGKGVGGWVGDPAMMRIRNLYPVEFPSRLGMTENNVYAAKEPWPVELTREGLEADFLNPADTATAGREVWADFPGVYSYCPVRGPKPGATVYARYSDPRARQGGQQPVYFAGQFYGAGSVFYLGSGEMWRLRAIDETYFEQFYTKLIRHVSQGRLMRGSSRGVLLVGQDRCTLGNTMEIRAQLSNARLEPLDLPSVNLQVIDPNGTAQTMPLAADPTRAGAYLGRLPALAEGTYRLELPLPESDNERLTRRVQVKAPELERENPRRNDALLSSIASASGGNYYVGVKSAFGLDDVTSLAGQLKDRTATSIVTDAPDRAWEETFLRWMMGILCGLLCLEWLIRRLMKLA